MNHPEFVKLVADMRQAQRDYFRERTPGALQTSKDLERRVDLAVKEFDGGQQQLFGGDGG